MDEHGIARGDTSSQSLSGLSLPARCGHRFSFCTQASTSSLFVTSCSPGGCGTGCPVSLLSIHHEKSTMLVWAWRSAHVDCGQFMSTFWEI